MNETKKAVYLNEEDSARFVLFIRYYPMLAPLLTKRTQAAKVTVHFDDQGNPRLIEDTRMTKIVDLR